MSALSPELEQQLAALPKIELHVHLEGAVPPATLLTLAKRNNVDLGCTDEAGFRELYRFRDFRHFTTVYGDITSVLRQPEDFQLIIDTIEATAAWDGVPGCCCFYGVDMITTSFLTITHSLLPLQTSK